LSETIPPEQMQTLLKTFSSMVETTNRVEDYLEKNYAQQAKPELIDKIRINLLTRGKDLFSQEVDPTKLEKQLADARADLVLFASITQTMKREMVDLNFDDFKEISLESQSGKSLTAKEKQSIREIVADNWSAFPDFLPFVMKGIDQALEKNDNQFYLIRHGKDLVAFCRFDPLENNQLYGASLNVRPDLRGSNIGRLFKDKVIDKKAERQVIQSDAIPELPIIPNYLREFGMTINGIKKNYGGSGRDLWNFETDKEANKSYQYQSKSTAEIMDSWKSNIYEPNQAVVILKQDISKGFAYIMNKSDEIIKNGNYVMTAYRPDPENKKTVYTVFEKKPISKPVPEAAKAA
ncbi:GNAT family N-acetyltransferase, partial [Patescibacteria group bacterium]